MFYLSHTVAIRMLFYSLQKHCRKIPSSMSLFRKLISLSESVSQKVRIRFTESGFGIRHYKSNQICSLLLATDGYRSLQHVTARYSTLQHVTARYSTLQHVTDRYKSLLLIPSFSNNAFANVN